MKHHLTETHEQNFEIHNIVLSSSTISLIYMLKPPNQHILALFTRHSSPVGILLLFADPTLNFLNEPEGRFSRS